LSPGYEDGSALIVLPDVTKDRSCHEKRRPARIYVIVRDGTPNKVMLYDDIRFAGLFEMMNERLDSVVHVD